MVVAKWGSHTYELNEDPIYPIWTRIKQELTVRTWKRKTKHIMYSKVAMCHFVHRGARLTDFGNGAKLFDEINRLSKCLTPHKILLMTQLSFP